MESEAGQEMLSKARERTPDALEIEAGLHCVLLDSSACRVAFICPAEQGS